MTIEMDFVETSEQDSTSPRAAVVSCSSRMTYEEAEREG